MNFYGNKMSKENKHYSCLSVILWDSIFVNSDKEYYPQVFLKECKYTVKNKKIMNTIKEELDLDKYDDEYDYILIFYGFNNVCYVLVIQY